MPYVDLSRRFRELTPEELESPELLAALNEHSLRQAEGWSELLQYPRVLLLAEAGSGKTEEMKEQAKRLLANDKPAFFLELESLDRELFLSSREKQIFDAWKMDDQATAWFFLDAVDELKLTGGRLGRALRRLASEIDGHLHRAHVVISCRPSDWRPLVDMATFRETLPFTSVAANEFPESDELFLAVLRKHEGGQKATKKNTVGGDSPRAVVLLPLSERQVATLAHSCGIGDTEEFLAEIRRRDAWTFARRPLDLTDLVTSWRTNRRLGTRAEQHEANVAAKLQDDPERRDHGLLTDERARIGAERLALALTLTRTRTIRSPELAFDSDRGEGVLEPKEILTGWNERERQALLRRALFDPATYGRVRFHHRSVQEYLAACRLRALREKGMPAKRLYSLLFAERYDERLVIPSMQAIAAWLALWDEDVRRELMAREPETLLAMGDPGSLPIKARAQLMRMFSEVHGEGGWRGLDIPVLQIRRLADPELAGVVRELWEAKQANPEVKELLLETIWQGPIEDCVDIVRPVAFDVDESEYSRIAAIRALAACREAELMQELRDSVLNEPAKWPSRALNVAAEELFPGFLSVTGLVSLLQRKDELKDSNCPWFIKQIVETIEPLSVSAIQLRDALTNLIWRGRHEKQVWYHLRGEFDSIAPALARLCDRQLEAEKLEHAFDDELIWACAVAILFSQDEVGASGFIEGLKRHFENNLTLREAAFWSVLKVVSEAVPEENPPRRYARNEQKSLIGHLVNADRSWLLKSLRSSAGHDRRLLALYALIRLWFSSGRQQVELDELSAAVQEDVLGSPQLGRQRASAKSRRMGLLVKPESVQTPDLLVSLAEVLLRESTPLESDREYEKLQRRDRRVRLVREGRKRQHEEDWLSWKKQLVSDPEGAFKGEVLLTTARNLYMVLDLANQDRGTRYNAWSTNTLERVFGEVVTAQAAKAFQAIWREHSPTLWSQRPIDRRNSILWVWCEGLTGLAAEAQSLGWANRLTQGEARTAATYATIELNGFPAWLDDLAAAHPSIVDAVIGGELGAELALEQEHSRTLQHLSYASISVKSLLAPHLLAALFNWPSVFKNEECSRHEASHLVRVLDILSDVVEDEGRAPIGDLCIERFSSDPTGPLALEWLQGAFRFDPVQATRVLEEGLASIPVEDRSRYAIRMFASLFGGRSIVFQLSDESKRVATLYRLVRCAYHYVPPAEDQHHEGVYSPDERDHAERARGYLLMTLVDTPGPEARKIVLDLAADPAFGHFPDRVRFLARQRAAKDAEGLGLKPEDVLHLEKAYEAPPCDREGLSAVMLDRLDDLAHNISHHDFSDRRTLQKIKDEVEIQRTLALRLELASKDAYVVSREEEVADSKRTDIRLAATRGNLKAVIEVKISSKWTLVELEQALRVQLVGQYLRHTSCRVGCLMLVYEGRKKFWKHPQTNKRLDFSGVVDHLNALAQGIEQEMKGEVLLSVYPLDLRDPDIFRLSTPR